MKFILWALGINLVGWDMNFILCALGINFVGWEKNEFYTLGIGYRFGRVGKN